jgi:hypothetical protein
VHARIGLAMLLCGGLALAGPAVPRTAGLAGEGAAGSPARQDDRSAGVRAVETLRAVSALPPHLINRLQDPTAIVVASSGEHLILDRRMHGVFLIDAAGRGMTRLLDVGYEPGRLLQPGSMAISGDDIFAVLDAPNDLQRIQYFDLTGRLLNGFFLPIVGTPRMVIGETIISGVGALAFTGRTFLAAEPAWGSLFAELDTDGRVIRHVGQLRLTGRESDRDLHLALNTGLPLVDPTGGFYFVFQTGIPLFRKYDRSGRLLFERHIEGPELDPLIQALPTTWPRTEGRRPIVPPLVRTAAVDGAGRLWVSLREPYTYVYSPAGERVRVVQFVAAGVTAPSHLFFRRGGRVVITPGGYTFDGR